MARKLMLATASLAMAAAPTTLNAASMGFNLRLQVPVYCTIVHQMDGHGASTGNGVALGRFREYCNAPGGYQLVVRYTPGTLRGAMIVAGEDQVVLNGSGQAILSQSNRPRVRERVITATPGAEGFDADRLEFQLIPA